jgi:uncharacterized paraquat-inducible protein A
MKNMNERYEPQQYTEHAKESCHYCHSTTLQQVGNEKVCAHCGTRVYSTAGSNLIKLKATKVNLALATI